MTKGVVIEVHPGERPTPRGVTAAALKLRQFAPVRWVVPDYIPDGLTMLAAKPKIGKSWLMLGVCVAAARGGATLDKFVAQGSVLYCALEDSERRLKARMEKAAVGGDWPARLEFWTSMDRLEHGGLEQLQDWINKADSPRLIVIDTFAKVRSPKLRDETAYEADYRAAGVLKTLADATGVSVVVVHHTRKMDAEDPLDAVSGTTGLTGAVDTILVLKRGAEGVTLYGRGRDVEEIELAVEFERETCRWRVLGNASEVRVTEERGVILEALRDEEAAMTPAQIAAVTGKARGAVRRLVTKMAAAGELKKLKRGEYALP